MRRRDGSRGRGAGLPTLTGAMLAAAVLGGAAPPAGAQVVVDRMVAHVYEQVITQSDVWQAVRLHLIQPPVDDFALAQRGLENRLLILREVARIGVEEPAPDAMAAHRSAWEATFASPADLQARLDRSGMTPAALEAWFRDDVRLAAWLEERFGTVPPADRPRARADWIRALRERAGLDIDGYRLSGSSP